MVFNFNLFENINFSCFFGKREKKMETSMRSRRTSRDLDKEIYKVSREFKISILPITQQFDIDNLYPLTDHVELWNIFIIGNDKTYILANVRDLHINIPNHDALINHKAHNILPDELSKMFDAVWDKTLSGKQLQFYMVWNGKLYFINTYPFFNGARKVIGAILFMRAFETMPELRFTTADGNLVPMRPSTEYTQAPTSAPASQPPPPPAQYPSGRVRGSGSGTGSDMAANSDFFKMTAIHDDSRD